MNLSTSDIIQICSIVASSLLAIIAVTISYFTLRITSTSIKEANRPVVVAFEDYIQVVTSIHVYVVIKNFGTSPAIIDNIDVNPGLKSPSGALISSFDDSSGMILAPQQSITMPISVNPFGEEFRNYPKNLISIKYHSGKQKFEENFVLNHQHVRDIAFIKPAPSKSKSVSEIIAKSSEEFLRRNL